MSTVPFKATGGIEVEGDFKLANLPSGSPASGGRILSLSPGGVAHYRTHAQMKSSVDAGRLDEVVAGNGMQVSVRPGGADGNDTQTITLGTPDTLTAITTDAATTTSHTHAITSSDDTSAASASTLLSANSTGGLKVAELATGTSIKITDHVTKPAITANKLYSNSSGLFWETTDLAVGTGTATGQFVSGIAIVMAIALG
jgi:hypothetical protein